MLGFDTKSNGIRQQSLATHESIAEWRLWRYRSGDRARHRTNVRYWVESGHTIWQEKSMHEWGAGFTASQLEAAQGRYGIKFPQDLFTLLLDRSPAGGYDWAGDDPRINEMLSWPLDMLLFDVDHGMWWPAWGERPTDLEMRREVVRAALRNAPRLIPIFGHRFLPEIPSEPGNPVISMHGFDTVYYGASLEEYFANEFNGTHHIGSVRHIPFWSDMVDDCESIFTGAPYDR